MRAGHTNAGAGIRKPSAQPSHPSAETLVSHHCILCPELSGSKTLCHPAAASVCNQQILRNFWIRYQVLCGFPSDILGILNKTNLSLQNDGINMLCHPLCWKEDHNTALLQLQKMESIHFTSIYVVKV